MWLRRLRVQHLKLLRDVVLTLPEPERDPKTGLVTRAPWTVLIGRNGTGKTTILQAIALAAAGNAGALDLAPSAVREQFPDLRSTDIPAIDALFEFGDIGKLYGKRPYADSVLKPSLLQSRVRLSRGKDPLQAMSWYGDSEQKDFRPGTEEADPLVKARADNANHWFVAGYGMSRYLRDLSPENDLLSWPSIDRLRPLFGNVPLTGMKFAAPGVLSEELRSVFLKTLQRIVREHPDILPGITNIELRGRADTTVFIERPRFKEKIGKDEHKLPATWFAHGHQSTMAWIADLVGHVLYEANVPVEPENMEGLVLIDEIDLYLHPTWQVKIIRALRETFPKIQFIATTHSPILLTELRKEEVIVLERNPQTGDVDALTPKHDPRLLTGTELYEYFFGIDELYPAELGRLLHEYLEIAVNPYRSDEEDQRVDELKSELTAQGLKPARPKVDRRPAPQSAFGTPRGDGDPKPQMIKSGTGQ